jgi:hypothetical protein
MTASNAELIEESSICSPFAYATAAAPDGYKCSDCGAAGVKLWREYQTLADCVTLRCAACACRKENREDDVDAQGKIKSEHGSHRIDQIGWLVPAVPTEDGQTFWGYSSVPQPGVVWWKSLPTRAN